MNVILVSNKMSKAVSLGPRHVTLIAIVLLMALMGMVTTASWVTWSLTRQLGWHIPVIPGTRHAEQQQIDALAVKLGQIQAQMLRLDSLTRNVANKTGIDPTPFQSQQPAPQGGARSIYPEHALSLKELSSEMDKIRGQIGNTMDQYDVIEALLASQRSTAWAPPSKAPMNSGEQSSSFGWRIDPFNGRQAFHAGIDFAGDVGSTVTASASGTVISAERHPEYGNMVEIDHGNGITTRYAHMLKIGVQEGATVKAGQQVGLLGNTGRSTGPHLHFEVRYKGIPQNPLFFLGGLRQTETLRTAARQ
ncbi:M23 family metallopeptidase [Burkholderiaceae bacterium DAT-1]|nr:M23 family metallopeptidase [Burkholderiaceae bacterium DAT-1]